MTESSGTVVTEKRTSYPSKQIRAGPAPLASFEDLPSDELESPEETEPQKDEGSNQDGDNKTKENATLLSSSTLDSLTMSAQSTPQIERDFNSHFTLTPVEDRAKSSFRTGSLSSLTKEDSASLAKEKKGSVTSLGNYESSESDMSQRKSSWTDIFRSHPPATKTSSDSSVSQETKGRTAVRTRSELPKLEHSETKAKEKGKFLSLFKVGKKSGKPGDSAGTPVKQNPVAKEKVSKEKVTESFIDAGFRKGKENEAPVPESKEPPQVQNDLDKTSAVTDSATKSCGEVVIARKNFNIAEKEFNIFSVQSEETCEKTINKCESIAKSIEDGHESSECELSFEVKEELVEVSKKEGGKDEEEEEENDFEAEKLLPQDSSEIEDDSSSELHPIPVFPSSQMVRISRPRKREVTTIPVERPRSTTPINAAPLEAYIRAASPSSDLKVEKIKLSLPGEQFGGHMKSPKRNTTKSWSDFCEEILHSPRAQKKDDFGSSDGIFGLEIKGNKNPWASKQFSDPWVTFETRTEATDPFSSSQPYSGDGVADDVPGGAFSEQEKKFVRCSCDCHSHGCDSVYINTSIFNENHSSQGSAKVDVFSDKCQCQCHEKYVHLWSPVGSLQECNSFCDIKTSELFTDLMPSHATQACDP